MTATVEDLKARGNAQLAEGDVAGALATYEAALAQCDGSTAPELVVALRLNASLLCLKRGDADAALAHAQAAAALAPTSAKAHYRAACAHLQRGDLAQARSEAEFAQKLAPGSADVQRLCASVADAQRTRTVSEARAQAQQRLAARRARHSNSDGDDDADVAAAVERVAAEVRGSAGDAETRAWADDACGTCAAIARECAELGEMLAQRVRAEQLADVADVDAELAAWEAALARMTPLEKLQLARTLGETRAAVAASARAAEERGMPDAAQGVLGRLRALLDEVSADAGARGGPAGQGVARAAELVRAEVDRLSRRLDFDGCLQRVDDLVLKAVGGKVLDGSSIDSSSKE